MRRHPRDCRGGTAKRGCLHGNRVPYTETWPCSPGPEEHVAHCPLVTEGGCQGSHFTDEETEAGRTYAVCPSSRGPGAGTWSGPVLRMWESRPGMSCCRGAGCCRPRVRGERRTVRRGMGQPPAPSQGPAERTARPRPTRGAVSAVGPCGRVSMALCAARPGKHRPVHGRRALSLPARGWNPTFRVFSLEAAWGTGACQGGNPTPWGRPCSG